MSISRQFDPIFARHRGELPTAYLRTLAKRESDLNPQSRGTSAWGILQVVEVVRRDYNERNRTNYVREQLLDPEVCTIIAADLLNRIVKAYRTNHGSQPNMSPDWGNVRFVELLTFGWNAGYSEGGGVGRICTYLARKGIAPTIESVRDNSSAAGAAATTRNDDKVDWCKGVASLYMTERAIDGFGPPGSDGEPGGKDPGPTNALVAGGAALAVVKLGII